MSTNCVRCVKNRRTGTDLLCDDCRANPPAPLPSPYWDLGELMAKLPPLAPELAVTVEAAGRCEQLGQNAEALERWASIAGRLRRMANELHHANPRGKALAEAAWHVLMWHDKVKARLPKRGERKKEIWD